MSLLETLKKKLDHTYIQVDNQNAMSDSNNSGFVNMYLTPEREQMSFGTLGGQNYSFTKDNQDCCRNCKGSSKKEVQKNDISHNDIPHFFNLDESINDFKIQLNNFSRNDNTKFSSFAGDGSKSRTRDGTLGSTLANNNFSYQYDSNITQNKTVIKQEKPVINSRLIINQSTIDHGNQNCNSFEETDVINFNLYNQWLKKQEKHQQPYQKLIHDVCDCGTQTIKKGDTMKLELIVDEKDKCIKHKNQELRFIDIETQQLLCIYCAMHVKQTNPSTIKWHFKNFEEIRLINLNDFQA